MTNKGISLILVIVLFVFASGMVCDFAQAREKKPQTLTPSQRSLDEGTLRGQGKKGGGTTPTPPADPHCTNGSAGPIDHAIEKRSCRVNGQDGVRTCYIKTVKCLSGPGEDEYAQTQNCSDCVVVPNRNPGQAQTPTGR